MKNVSIDPFGWGVLFFTFWLTILTLPIKQTSYNVFIAWFSLAISALFFASILWPWLRAFLDKPAVKRIYAPTIFVISAAAYILGWLGSLPALSGGTLAVAIFGGTLWFLLADVILIRSVPIKFGIVGPVAFIIAGLYFILFSHQPLSGLVSIGFGVLTLIVMIAHPKWLWSGEVSF